MLVEVFNKIWISYPSNIYSNIVFPAPAHHFEIRTCLIFRDLLYSVKKCANHSKCQLVFEVWLITARILAMHCWKQQRWKSRHDIITNQDLKKKSWNVKTNPLSNRLLCQLWIIFLNIYLLLLNHSNQRRKYLGILFDWSNFLPDY